MTTRFSRPGGSEIVCGGGAVVREADKARRKVVEILMRRNSEGDFGKFGSGFSWIRVSMSLKEEQVVKLIERVRQCNGDGDGGGCELRCRLGEANQLGHITDLVEKEKEENLGGKFVE